MKLNPPIAVCKLCFKEYQPITLLDIFDEHNCYCKKCISEISPVFIKFKVGRYKAIAIYEYSHKIQSLLYQFKGCFDVELFGIFIERFRRELKFRYCDYVLIPAPSFKKDDEERGFNHVVEMTSIAYKRLRLKPQAKSQVMRMLLKSFKKF